MDTKTASRKRARHARQSLAPEVRIQASADICQRISQQPSFQQAKHVAGYLPLKNEVDLRPLLQRAIKLQKQVWIPRVLDRHMTFAAYHPDNPMEQSALRTRQPDALAQTCDVRAIDVVLLPLLAFTRSGIRLGMGGGYYDRAFSFMLPTAPATGPLLIGAAFANQEADTLPQEPWDVPLQHIVTQSDWITCV